MFLRVFAFIFLCMAFSLPSFGCHDPDCPHTQTETGVHWSRSLRFSYKDQEFNLIETHEKMSKRAEIREKKEEMEFLNLALCNLQFVYKGGESYTLSLPFEIKKQDRPFFSNLSENQVSHSKLIKFPQAPLTLENYKRIEELIASIRMISLNKYEEEKVERENLVSYIEETLEENSNKKQEKSKKLKRKRDTEEEFYNKFIKKLKKGKVHNAKIYYEKKLQEINLADNIQEKSNEFFSLYKELKEDLQNDINSYILTSRNKMLFKRLFIENDEKEKLKVFEKNKRICKYIKYIESLLLDCEKKLAHEEKILRETPLNYALRRLQAPQEDFEKDTLLPINKDAMLQDLNTDEPAHLRHTEQLVMHHLNNNFSQIEKGLQTFLRKNKLQNKKIHGVFYNLFSTRDMCERCAVCLTLDHAANNGFTAKLRGFLNKHNANLILNLFIVYTVSSRLPYATPYGADKINSREYAKGVDAQSNSEIGRETTELSDANISIQTTFFSHVGKEFTPKDLIKHNKPFISMED